MATILKIVSHILRLLPRQSVAYVGQFVGKVLLLLDSRRYNITVSNIREALPDRNSSTVKSIARSAYDNLGIVLTELVLMHTMDVSELFDRVSFESPDHLRNSVESGRPVILLSGHFGNWEMMAAAASALIGRSIHIVVKSQSNQVGDKLLKQTRKRFGNHLLDMGSAARDLVKIMRGSGVVAMLADQAAPPRQNVFVDFFGRPASTFLAPASMALHYDAIIVFGVAIRQSAGTYMVRTHLIDSRIFGGLENPALSLTRKHVELLEQEIREHPGLWAWQHKRWKHEPR